MPKTPLVSWSTNLKKNSSSLIFANFQSVYFYFINQQIKEPLSTKFIYIFFLVYELGPKVYQKVRVVSLFMFSKNSFNLSFTNFQTIYFYFITMKIKEPLQIKCINIFSLGYEWMPKVHHKVRKSSLDSRSLNWKISLVFIFKGFHSLCFSYLNL